MPLESATFGRAAFSVKRFHLLLVLGVWASAACRASDTPQVPPPDVHQAIHSRSDYETLPALALVPARPGCTVGALDCSPGSEVQAVVDSGGRLLVWDIKVLQEVAGEGSTARLVGRVGEGPGEYHSIVAAGFSRSGEEMLVLDFGQQRLLRYDRSGNPAATSRVELPPGFINASFVRGELRALAVDIAGGSGAPDSASVSVFALEPDGKKPRRLFTLPVRQRAWAMGDLRPVPQRFAATPQWQLLSDGHVLYSPGDSLSVHRFDGTGAPVLHAGFDVQPRQVTEDEVERSLEDILRRAPNAQMREAMRARVGQAAERHPGITSLRQLENGQLWIREAPRAAGDSVRWLVFDSAGTTVGSLMLDTESRVLAAAQGLILVSQPGAEDPSESLIWMRVTLPVGSTSGSGSPQQ